MGFNFKGTFNVIGILLIINGLFMFLCIPWSLIYGQAWIYMLYSGLITAGAGTLLYLYLNKKGSNDLKKQDGYLVVSLGWLSMSFFGTLPYLFSGSIPDFTNAFFETISGFTTTGASILNNIESMPAAILFWRSLTQWIGGMGIIVLAVAILPLLGIGGMELFGAESPGITPEKVKPKIKDTAKRLWLIYLGLTLSESILLWFGGMTYFDALNHSLTTMATGGFSTKQASIAHWDSPYIHYVIIIFMFLAGTNFSITYFGLKGKFSKVFGNEEFRGYLIVLMGFSILGTLFLLDTDHGTIEKSFRDITFQVISVITTTGFVTSDYTAWKPLLTVIFFLLMFIGGSTGSTSGGIKITRHLLLFKNSFLELKRQLHPKAVIPVRLNNKAVKQDIVYNVLAFIMIYLTVFALGMVLFSLTGADFKTTIGAVATSVGNIGPGLGDVGPAKNFSHVTSFGKWVLSLLMLLGRLELFTVLMLFSPWFWKR